MRDNFDEVLPYVGSWGFFPLNGFNKGHPNSSRGCQVLFEKIPQSVMHNVLVNLRIRGHKNGTTLIRCLILSNSW